MSKYVKIKAAKSLTGTHYRFWCRACQRIHFFDVRDDGGDHDNPSWTFNGDYDKPSFCPSLRLTTYPFCHLIMTDGIIQYCGDSKHFYAGKDIPVEEYFEVPDA